MNLQNLRRLWMILINDLLMMIDLLGRLLVDDLWRRWIMLLIDNVLLQLCRGVWVGDQRVMAVAHGVIGAVFSRVVRWFVVGVSIRWVTIFSTFETSIKRTVGQIEVNCRLVYRHLSDAKNLQLATKSLKKLNENSPNCVECFHHCIFRPWSWIRSWQLDTFTLAATIKRS